MAPKLDPSSDVRSLAETLAAIYDDLEQIRVYVITDRSPSQRASRPATSAARPFAWK
jgi:hypothetical protein